MDNKKILKERNEYYLGAYVVFTMFTMFLSYCHYDIVPKYAPKLMARTGYMKHNDWAVMRLCNILVHSQ